MAKGYSLHIGLNYVNPNFYANRWKGKLNCCLNDANAMLQIAKEEGYSVSKTLFNEMATRENVIAELKEFALILEANDIFMLTYSGHGSSLPDYNKDEKDRVDETWCLYNGMLVDDELFEIYSMFKEDVRILVISDSCHSGTVARGIEEENKEDIMEKKGYLPKRMEKAMAEVVYQDREDFYDEILKRAKTDLSKLKANLIVLAACQDDQKAYEGFKGYGNFTQQLLNIRKDGGSKNNYKTYHQLVREEMSEEQVPNLDLLGKGSRLFLKQVPFKIEVEYIGLTLFDRVSKFL